MDVDSFDELIGRARPPDSKEEPIRRRIIVKLLACFGAVDIERAQVYIEETRAIPLDKLAVAVRGVIRSHCWATVPRIGEIWKLAREAARMGREQYHAGRYTPALSEWPPVGQRHGVLRGTFEPLAILEEEEMKRIAGPKEFEAGK